MKKLKHLLAILFAFGLLGAVLYTLYEADLLVKAKNNSTDNITSITLKPVSILSVKPITAQAIIHSYSVVKPRKKNTVKSRVRGEILKLSKNLETGKHLKKGELLFSFDDSHYQTLLAETKNQIAQAELLLQDEIEKSKLARNDWKLLRRKGRPSSFALRAPQIKAAKAQLELAKTHLKQTLKSAKYSKIIAPFNSIVLSRSVSKGDIVESGQTLAEIISSDELEITVQLDSYQWQLLGKKWKGKSVAIIDINDTSQHWQAVIERESGVIDEKTRKRTLYLSLKSPNTLQVGSFIKVEILGKTIKNVLKIPHSAISLDGFVWLVDSNNRLQHFKSHIQFSKNQTAFINQPDLKSSNYSIVASPLSSFFPDMEVTPKQVSSHASIN